ncbi:MAG: FAD-dependent monooxygenase [Planctomycetota bacterium]|nr:FAD-dependent monooxygenase [Planctomycetota bacterium]
MIAATTSLSEARGQIWDTIVVGGGPAGSVAALGIARRGLRVLLVDRSEFPRHKLCGACLNGDAIAGLCELSLTEPFRQLGGLPLNEFRLRTGRRTLSLQLPSGVAVTRRRFDAMLIEAAIQAGADFLPGVSLDIAAGTEDTCRHLTTSDRIDSAPLRGRSIVLASGLAADRRTTDPGLAVVATPASRIGAGTTTSQFPADYTPGTIFMAVGRTGYVGLTRTDGDALNIAAALDHTAVRNDSPRGVCEQILAESGFPVTTEMLSGEWRGTVGLTRHRRTLASTRLFVIGDAAGYVEPFTGEGMAWAIRGAQAVVPFVERATETWDAGMIAAWSRTLKRLIGRRQRSCRILAQFLRYPAMVRGLVRIVETMPSLGQAVVRRLNGGTR